MADGGLLGQEEESQPKHPSPTDRDLGPGRTALLGAIATLVATLTLIATVNGEIARMFRNHPVATTSAIGLELLAILCGC